jgi:hypothetical protein
VRIFSVQPTGGVAAARVDELRSGIISILLQPRIDERSDTPAPCNVRSRATQVRSRILPQVGEILVQRDCDGLACSDGKHGCPCPRPAVNDPASKIGQQLTNPILFGRHMRVHSDSMHHSRK